MKDLTDKIYQDRKVFCKDCSRFIGQQTLDAQILILENGLIAWNYFAFQCPCGRNGSWSAPLLPNEPETPDALFPDTPELQNRAKKLSSIGVSKLNNKYRARANVGGKTRYLGLFNTETEARQAVLSAKTTLTNK